MFIIYACFFVGGIGAAFVSGSKLLAMFNDLHEKTLGLSGVPLHAYVRLPGVVRERSGSSILIDIEDPFDRTLSRAFLVQLPDDSNAGDTAAGRSVFVDIARKPGTLKTRYVSSMNI